MWLSADDVEFALRKQRLQWQSAALRERLVRQAESFAPAFAAADRVAEGYQWLKRNPAVTLAALLAFALVRPRRAFRWARRSVLVWQGYRRIRVWLTPRRPGSGPR